MFHHSAVFYDLLYSFKDYAAEVARLREIVAEYGIEPGASWLDAACGTGKHLELLQNDYAISGLDLDKELVMIGRERLAGVPICVDDMITFDYHERFDVISCLFSAIGYVRTAESMRQAVANMARHLKPGGLLVVEPWFEPDEWHAPSVHVLNIDEPDFKLTRMNTSLVEGTLSYFDLHYLIGTSEETVHFVERHELGLFTREEMTAAYVDAGLAVEFDVEGLIGRGLYVGQAPK